MEKELKYTAETIVTEQNTASFYGSGGVDVFATPAMVALMENAARHAVAIALPPGSSTVGVAVNITHTRATPIGKTVYATAILRTIDGRKLIFDVEAYDDNGIIGTGTHTRVIVETERFMSNVKK